ncbi:tyrosine-type recombinase/integrase [Citromicrobium bathyomarinum]|uniref:tyrosine-type recombinase/integrase n=1 Tax=Citromicrobium bathyomarinum TaxID=72174 RepID=UPI003159E3FE
MSRKVVQLRGKQSPLVKARFLPDLIGNSYDPDELIDLRPYRGWEIDILQTGVASLLNVRIERLKKLQRLHCLEFSRTKGKGPAIVLRFDPAWGLIDLWDKWINRMGVPHSLADFDHIREVRHELQIPSGHPYPDWILRAAFEFLDRHAAFSSPEARMLIHFTQSKDDPTQVMLNELGSSSKYRPDREWTTIKAFAKENLPENLRVVPGTALDDQLGDELSAPDKTCLSRLSGLAAFRTAGILHAFRLAASGVRDRYQAKFVRNLVRLEELLLGKDAMAGLDACTVMTKFAEILDSAEDNRAKTIAVEIIKAYFNMQNDMKSFMIECDLVGHPELTFPIIEGGTELHARFKGTRNELREANRASRMEEAGPLADQLDDIASCIERRWHDIAKLLDHTRSAAALAKVANDDCLSFQTSSFVENGPVDRGMRTDNWEIWKPEAYLDRLKEDYEALAHMPGPINVWAAYGRKIDNEPYYLIYKGSTVGDASSDPPFFVELFQNAYMDGHFNLNRNIRQRRFEAIGAGLVPKKTATVAGLLHFDQNGANISRVALNRGDVMVPIEQFAMAMRIARTSFLIGRDTAVRSAELLQILGDGSNLVHDPDSDLAGWTAYPKGKADDDVAGGRKAQPVTYSFGLAALKSLEELQAEVMAAFGNNGTLDPIRRPQQLDKLKGKAVQLFRGHDRACTGGHIKLFLTYLTFGIHMFSMHSLRSAVAKDLTTRGYHPDFIRQLLGHTSYTTTRSYAASTRKMRLAGISKRMKERELMTAKRRAYSLASRRSRS